MTLKLLLRQGPVYRPTDIGKAIYPLFFKGGHNKHLLLLIDSVNIIAVNASQIFNNPHSYSFST
jgi:hypothetical protein